MIFLGPKLQPGLYVYNMYVYIYIYISIYIYMYIYIYIYMEGPQESRVFVG